MHGLVTLFVTSSLQFSCFSPQWLNDSMPGVCAGNGTASGIPPWVTHIHRGACIYVYKSRTHSQCSCMFCIQNYLLIFLLPHIKLINPTCIFYLVVVCVGLIEIDVWLTFEVLIRQYYGEAKIFVCTGCYYCVVHASKWRNRNCLQVLLQGDFMCYNFLSREKSLHSLIIFRYPLIHLRKKIPMTNCCMID